MKPPALGKRVAVFLAAAAVTSLWFINWCHFVYRCGCRSWWNGAAVACNIHVPDVPHCPWCVNDGAAGYISYGAILVVQALAAFGPIGSLGGRAAGAFLAFPAVGGLLAVGFGLWMGYWQARW